MPFFSLFDLLGGLIRFDFIDAYVLLYFVGTEVSLGFEVKLI